MAADEIIIETTSQEVIEVGVVGPQGPAGATGPQGPAGAGGVTSVALASSDFAITGSPITSSGTITANIAENAVTLEKLQTISSQHLLGRHGSGIGGVQQIGLGTGLAMSGSNVGITFGTTTGTAAAGDDSRITGAAQKSSNLSDLSSASTARTNLGLGTAAVEAASAFAQASHSHELTALAATGATNGHVLTANGSNGATFAALPASGVTGAASSASDVLGVSGANITGVDANADRIVYWNNTSNKLEYGTPANVGAAAAIHTHAASDVTSGVFDNARINFAAPSAIGGTSAAAGSFTTLSASTSLTLGTSGILSGGTNTIEQRNTTSAQTFRIYNTVSGAADANYERGFMRWSSNVLQIGTEKGGTGSARALELQVDGSTFLGATTGGTVRFGSQSTQSSTLIGWFGNCYLRPVNAAAGVLTLLNNALDGFDRLQFGGTTSSFPALKRSSTTLQVRLADDSAFAPFECAGLTLNGNLTASTRNIVTDTATGTRIGTGTTQLLGFWNATPAAQPAAVADATDAASTQARLNDLLARLRTIGIIAT